MMKSENEDLRVSLRINKESLQSLIEQKAPQQSALIRTIDVISSENAKLTLTLERLKAENDQLKSAIIQTGRSMAVSASSCKAFEFKICRARQARDD